LGGGLREKVKNEGGHKFFMEKRNEKTRRTTTRKKSRRKSAKEIERDYGRRIKSTYDVLGTTRGQ